MNPSRDTTSASSPPAAPPQTPRRGTTRDAVKLGAFVYRIDQASTRHRAAILIPPGAQHPREVVVHGRMRGDRPMTFDDLSTGARVALGRVLYSRDPLRCDNMQRPGTTHGRSHGHGSLRAVARCTGTFGRQAAQDFGVTPEGKLLCGDCCA